MLAYFGLNGRVPSVTNWTLSRCSKMKNKCIALWRNLNMPKGTATQSLARWYGDICAIKIHKSILWHWVGTAVQSPGGDTGKLSKSWPCDCTYLWLGLDRTCDALCSLTDCLPTWPTRWPVKLPREFPGTPFLFNGTPENARLNLQACTQKGSSMYTFHAVTCCASTSTDSDNDL